MKKYACFLIIPLLVSLASGQSLKNDPQLFTAKKASYLTDDEKDVIAWLNYIRAYPREFSQKILEPYAEEKDIEKSKYVKSLVKDLEKVDKLEMLKPSPGLTKAAKYHANDMGKLGEAGHNSSNGWDMIERLNNFVEWDVTVGENCAYGLFSPLEIVMSLLIDEGVEQLGHRKNILNPAFRVVGVAISPHKTFGTNCVQDFAGAIKGE